MRLWYRLSSLSLAGVSPFRIVARLNPDADVGNGFVVDRDGLLQFLRDLGREIVDKAKADAQRIVEGKREGSPIRDPENPENTRRREIAEFSVPPGVGLPAVLARAMEMKHRGWGSKEILAYLLKRSEPGEDPSGETGTGSVLGRTSSQAAEVARQQKAGRIRNKIVTMLEQGKEIRTDLAYADLGKSIGNKGPASGRQLGSDLADFAAGGRPAGPNRGLVAFLGTLMVVQEGHRNVGSVVSSAMVIDLLKDGRDVESTLTSLPMAMDKAQKGADDLERYLARTPEQKQRFGPTAKAKELVEREIDLIKVWITTLDIHADQDSKVSIEEQLRRHIRTRMYEFYYRQAFNPGDT
jgi:hypothetical protein